MIFRFTKLHIHHFLSFDDATIDLSQRGYCLISGVNKNPKDAARSNGSGKSTICNALSFALIGETINGLKSNLSNIYFNDGCYVELEFYVDNTKYKLLRSKDDKTYGTNLKIFVNDEDKSGKGVRESQAILDTLLPDITRELIGSVILLGQGLPDRFTANTPSRRKEVLEHLSKSDFMIQDLKKRLEERTSKINSQHRSQEDLEIKNNAEKTIYNRSLSEATNLLDQLSQDMHFEEKILEKKNSLKILVEEKERREEINRDLETREKTLNESILTFSNTKNDRLSNVYQQYVEYDKELSGQKIKLEAQIKTLKNEISKIQAIKDICPTCGQKIPNVHKPDTKDQELELEALNNKLKLIIDDINQNNNDYTEVKNKINNEFIESTTQLSAELKEIADKKLLNTTTSIINDITRMTAEIVSLEKDRDSHESRIIDCKNKIQEYSDKLKALEQEFNDITTNKLNLKEHLEVLSKMNTYIKRDFRGILLSNSIEYINKKAKEYASKIFNTDEVEFKLDGNNIDISFCLKDYENLSGGEKQRIDLITQFAIRDMLSRQVGFSSNILFLDEITDNLDKESCDKVIDFITNEFKDLESTFIISHHLDLDIPMDSEIIVYKDITGVTRI